MDVFWFFITCFFVFYLPYKLWLTKEEMADVQKESDAHKYNNKISNGALDIQAKQNFDLKVENAMLKNRVELLYEIIDNLELELEEIRENNV